MQNGSLTLHCFCIVSQNRIVFSDEFKREVERWGVARALYAKLMSRLNRWVVLCRVNKRPLTGTADDAVSSPATHRFATKSELIELAGRLPDELKDWALESEPDEFNQCWAAFLDGKIVSFIWRVYEHVPAGDGMMVGFERPYRYGMKAFTFPQYRGRHIFAATACDPHLSSERVHARHRICRNA